MFHGIRTYFFLRSKQKGRVSVRFPGINHPVWIRRNSSDYASFDQIFILENYRMNLPPGKGLIIDGGANAGHAAAYFACRFPEKKIIAVEPDASNCELIRKNISLYPNVELTESAIWNKNSYLKILNPEASQWAFRVEEVSPQTQGAFRSVTIGELLHQSGFSRIDLLKLDVEGAEKEIFSLGIENWLPHTGCIILEFHERINPGCTEAVEKAVSNLVRERFQQGENEVFILK